MPLNVIYFRENEEHPSQSWQRLFTRYPSYRWKTVIKTIHNMSTYLSNWSPEIPVTFSTSCLLPLQKQKCLEGKGPKLCWGSSFNDVPVFRLLVILLCPVCQILSSSLTVVFPILYTHLISFKQGGHQHALW